MTSRVSGKEGAKRGLPAKEKGFARARRHATSEGKAETTRRDCRVPNPYVNTSCAQDSASVPPAAPNSEDAVSRTYWETQQGSDHCLQAGPHSVTVPHLARPTQPTQNSVRNGTQQRAGGARTRVRQNHTAQATDWGTRNQPCLRGSPEHTPLWTKNCFSVFVMRTISDIRTNVRTTPVRPTWSTRDITGRTRPSLGAEQGWGSVGSASKRESGDLPGDQMRFAFGEMQAQRTQRHHSSMKELHAAFCQTAQSFRIKRNPGDGAFPAKISFGTKAGSEKSTCSGTNTCYPATTSTASPGSVSSAAAPGPRGGRANPCRGSTAERV
ncbi:uncharacterized protein LOC122489152 [Prionailurus bengalensis]|uniref:uncharacterized protein LOC122489152 n=1 Tax=Prionailurus bengalensis TaxID=37029 RepID=UPI001CAA24EA|nr:uncharacterized protein LOC122489152 [Prionailurus bengalensis]